MAARVIYFGDDDCYRVPVLRSAGYEVFQPQTLDELNAGLQKDAQVDAVFVSEDERRTTLGAIELVREHCTAPLILFRRSNIHLQENLCDQVYWPGARPEEWLSDTAELIAQCRESREQSQKLRRETQIVRGQSRWQRARSRMESKHNAPAQKPAPFPPKSVPDE